MSATVRKLGDPAGVFKKDAPAAAASPVAVAAAPVTRFAQSDADAAALADSKARGRAGTALAGQDATEADQMQRGLFKQKQRQGAASQALLG